MDNDEEAICVGAWLCDPESNADEGTPALSPDGRFLFVSRPATSARQVSRLWVRSRGRPGSMKLPLLWVDAFTTDPFRGNPCAVVLDSEHLDACAMQTIAGEMNLSETAFVRTSAAADFGVRYFTPAEEIPLAGHPTIATTWALIETGRVPLERDVTEISLELKEGPITVSIEHMAAPDGTPHETSPGAVAITMRQRRPRFLRTYGADDVAAAFGLDASDVMRDLPVRTVSTGTPQLMIPIRDHEALRQASLDVARYAALRSAGDFFSPHLFCLRGITPAATTFARHFGVPPDTAEDPFTGSATGGMAAYLWNHGVLDEPRFVAEQGHWMGRPGRAQVEVIGPRDAIETVLISGHAVTVLRGEIDVAGALALSATNAARKMGSSRIQGAASPKGT